MIPELSHHAKQQAARRNLTEQSIAFIMEYGKPQRATGVIFFQMLEKSLPKDVSPNDPMRKLVGATVVACGCGQFVITLYKNPKAFKADRKKDKTNRQKRAYTCPFCQTDTHIVD